METYKVNELFKSLQGEGFNLGREVVFVRLSKCNLDCQWCDTDFHAYEKYELDRLMKSILEFDCKSVILTGGEPSLHDLKPLLQELKKEDFWIGIETNGTNSIEHLNYWIDYIAISPKSTTKQFMADEVRMVNDSLTADDLLATEKKIIATNYYISPLEKGGKFNYAESLQLLSDINKRSNKRWLLSFQVHKLAGIQ